MIELQSLIQTIHAAVWGVPLLLLLIGGGIYLTCLLRGMQFRYLFRAFFMKDPKEDQSEKEVAKASVEGDISSFQSLMTAMASAVGTGSIVGAATAITAGGLGAIFWMWVTTLVTMAIKYAEALLAVKYRVVDERGEMAGGPMQYMERGLGWKWMATLFAVFASIAAIGTGNLVQINSVAQALGTVFDVEPFGTGIVLAVVTAFVLLKGIRGIGFVSSILVPVMASFYILAGIVVLFFFSSKLPEAVSLIFSSAFTGQAACGGFIGSTVMMAMQSGVSRSVFSSEAGLGISSIAAAAARTKSSAKQALLSMSATLLSTAIICSITALTIAVTGVMGSVDEAGKMINGAPLAIAAFNAAFSGGQYVVMLGLILFAYTTVIAWAYYGEKCFEYLFGAKSVLIYRIIYIALVIPGALFALEMVWSFANIMNGLMIIPNMVALLALSGVIQKETKEFLVKVEPKAELPVKKGAPIDALIAGES